MGRPAGPKGWTDGGWERTWPGQDRTMDGWFNVFPHTLNTTQTHTHTMARGSLGNCLRRQVGRTLTGEGRRGGRAESTTMRCDANETCWGNTVLCILRCAFWNRNRFIHILVFFFFFFLVGFSFSCLELSFCPNFWANQKRARTSITCILSSSSSYRKGGGAGEGRSNLCLFLVNLGNIGEFLSSLASRFSFIPQPCCCVFTPTIPNPPVLFLFLASGPPPTRSRGPGFPSHPSPLHPSLSNTQPDTPGRKGDGKGWYFHPSGSGGTGGWGSGRGVSMRWGGLLLEKENPLLLGTKPSAEIFNVGMGARRRAGGRRLLLAWTGRRGLLAWIWSQGKKFAMLTCDEQEVSAQLGCLYLSLPLYVSSTRVGKTGQPRPGSSKGKRNGGKPQRPTSSLPQREGEDIDSPSLKRLETRRLLVQSLLFISQRHNHTDILFNFLPLPP